MKTPATLALVTTFLSSAALAEPVATPEQLAEGKKNYMAVCMACHQPTGMGLPPVFPPITKSEYINGSAERLAAMILKGNAGPMTVDGKLYNNIMPPQEAMLTDEKIASVMTYVRASFGNSAPPVSADLVAATRKKFADRKTPWTEPELKGWKDDTATPAPQAAPATSAPAATPAPAGQ
jgi:mono/diheme cytochrome c family protein